MAKPVHVYTAHGMLEAEMIVNFLSSQGIEAMASQESVGMSYGLTVGPLGEVKVYVNDDVEADAHKALMDMEKGVYELPDNDEGETFDDELALEDVPDE
ncbi:MAG: DUF2007 domain-containing protein [Anaerolineaceae bacterium]|nr:DUF2007 domain-containing protein [Anaerolineaceae bacterium]